MPAHRKLAACLLVFSALAIALMALSFSFVQRLPPAIQGTPTEWAYWMLVALFSLVAALGVAMAYEFAFRVVDEPLLSFEASGGRVIRRLTGLWVPGAPQLTDFLLVKRGGGLWLLPVALESLK